MRTLLSILITLNVPRRPRRRQGTDARSHIWVFGGTLAHLCRPSGQRSCRYDLQVDLFRIFVSGGSGKGRHKSGRVRRGGWALAVWNNKHAYSKVAEVCTAIKAIIRMFTTETEGTS